MFFGLVPEQVMLRAKPFDIERIRIILMMGVDLQRSTILTGSLLQEPTTNGVIYRPIGFSFLWIFCAIVLAPAFPG